jgi:hypothetical protein
MTNAFTFGPTMRRIANLHFGGSLARALHTLSTPQRVRQHFADLDAMALPHRAAYAQAIDQADREPACGELFPVLNAKVRAASGG